MNTFNIVGAGNMGIAVAGALLRRKNKINVIDRDEFKLRALQTGSWTPEADEIWGKASYDVFTSIIESSKHPSDWYLICVQTPVDNGVCNYTVLNSVLRECQSSNINPNKIVILSTIFPNNDVDNHLFGVYHPVFLKAGKGTEDYLHPTKVVLGGDQDLCNRFAIAAGLSNARICTIGEAEWIKLIHNSFMCVKMTFANEFGRAIGANAHKVLSLSLEGDDRLFSMSHMKPGPPFDGPCMHKDSTVLKNMSEPGGLLEAAFYSNENHIDKIYREWATGKSPGIVGLSFRPGYDEMRESNALRFMLACPQSIGWDPVISKYTDDDFERMSKQGCGTPLTINDECSVGHSIYQGFEDTAGCT